jgi:hypothetical protein
MEYGKDKHQIPEAFSNALQHRTCDGTPMDTTIGNLGWTEREEHQLVEFLKTRTDGYTRPATPERQ